MNYKDLCLRMVLSMKRYKMTIKKASLCIATMLALNALQSCNVHEWPEDFGERYPFTLYLEFDADLPLYKEIYYTRAGEESSRSDEDNYDIRYIVNVYSVADENDNNRDVIESYTFTRPYVVNHDYQVTLSLPEGKYKFRVWSDHVATGTNRDHFYNTSSLTDIFLDESGVHPGSNEFRDAFRGTAYGEVYDAELYEERYGSVPSNSAKAEMQRPMGRYEFISTDMDEFLDKVVENVDLSKIAANGSRNEYHVTGNEEILSRGMTRTEIAEAIGLDQYKVVFSYNAFMPSSYNFYTDKPSDSSTGISYESKLNISDEGMKMGFDYILVDQQTTMNLNMNIYNPEGELISSTSGVEVPVVRNKNTVVKGLFLTVTSGGGVAINPDFEGDDFNIEIK